MKTISDYKEMLKDERIGDGIKSHPAALTYVLFFYTVGTATKVQAIVPIFWGNNLLRQIAGPGIGMAAAIGVANPNCRFNNMCYSWNPGNGPKLLELCGFGTDRDFTESLAATKMIAWHRENEYGTTYQVSDWNGLDPSYEVCGVVRISRSKYNNQESLIEYLLKLAEEIRTGDEPRLKVDTHNGHRWVFSGWLAGALDIFAHNCRYWSTENAIPPFEHLLSNATIMQDLILYIDQEYADQF